MHYIHINIPHCNCTQPYMVSTYPQDQPQQANEERQRREERRGEGAKQRGEGEERGAETWEGENRENWGELQRFEMITKIQQY